MKHGYITSGQMKAYQYKKSGTPEEQEREV